ncbi:MAG: hypothetical protein NVSMB32_04290 [Actinomycetota bacterium]
MHGGLAYLGVAFLAIWAAISGYLVVLSRRQRSIDRRLKDLQVQAARQELPSSP